MRTRQWQNSLVDNPIWGHFIEIWASVREFRLNDLSLVYYICLKLQWKLQKRGLRYQLFSASSTERGLSILFINLHIEEGTPERHRQPCLQNRCESRVFTGSSRVLERRTSWGDYWEVKVSGVWCLVSALLSMPRRCFHITWPISHPTLETPTAVLKILRCLPLTSYSCVCLFVPLRPWHLVPMSIDFFIWPLGPIRYLHFILQWGFPEQDD